MMIRVVEVEIIQFTLDDFDLFSSAEHEDEQTKCNVKYDSFCSFQCAPMINLSTQSWSKYYLIIVRNFYVINMVCFET